MTPQYAKLKALLLELFQLDQPDLDFGLYRVMHAKRDEVTAFLDKELLPQVQQAFAQYQSADKATLEQELAKVVASVEAAGLNPDDAPKVKELRARIDSEAVDVRTLEREVYDHLYSFFRRYYSEGDFLTKRVYKPGVYAIPYEGEEVTLHWANKDQYYIKTSEYLRHYTFRLRPDDAANPMRVHFRLVDAAEGEHGNVKATEGKERRFKLVAEAPLALEDGELVVRFTYQPDARKQAELNAEAEATILATAEPEFATWVAALRAPAPTDSARERTVMAKHLKGYSDRNTFDYFIHKDLGGFLRRELDFFIKNEVMHLDDVESETAPRVEQYLSKIKVVRRIAGKIINFLAQLENFQKKLWLKKKFVVETSWCVRLDMIPEEFYPEIAANQQQHEEWSTLGVDAGAIQAISSGGLTSALENEPTEPTASLTIDTRHFTPKFAYRLLEALGNVGELTDATLFRADNFHAVSLLETRFRRLVKCIYIDPPYNTEQDRATGRFLYKDTYERSSWLSLIASRLSQLRSITRDDGVLFASIDEHEVHRLLETSQLAFSDRIGVFCWVKKKKGSHLSKTIRDMTEFVVAVSPNKSIVELYGEDAYGDKAQPLAKRTNKAKELRFPAASIRTTLVNGEYGAGEYGTGSSAITFTAPFVVEDGVVVSAVCAKGPFVWTQATLDHEMALGSQVHLSKKFGFNVMRANQEDRVKRPTTLLDKTSDIGTNEDGSAEVLDLFGVEGIATYPKPVSLVSYFIRACALEDEEVTLDSFAGSGTTGHAVIALNRVDGVRRKFILVEQGDAFDTVLLPRIKKVTYTPEWKDGKPKRLATAEEAERGPRIVKVLRLESYEDTLNNLEPRRSDSQQLLLDAPGAQGPDGLKEQYVLRYMLDVETRGSQSLLNVQAFTDPTAYKLTVKRSGSDESRQVNVDLLETFNWLLGLTVRHIAAPQTFSAAFVRDSEGRLRLEGDRIKPDADGPFWFRTVTGTLPDGRKTLVIWRKRTGDPEQDNLVLDTWFTKQGYSSRDSEFDLIYVNGGTNLENLKTPDDRWKVRLLEEDFHRLMFEGTE